MRYYGIEGSQTAIPENKVECASDEKGEPEPFKTGAIAGAPGGSDSPSIKRLFHTTESNAAFLQPQTSTPKTSGGQTSNDSVSQFTENASNQFHPD